MKKFLLIALSLCLAAALTTACTRPGGDVSPNPPAAVQLEETEGPVPEFLAAEQQALYRRAKTAFIEFTLNTDGFGSSGGGGEHDFELNGMYYYRCNGYITRWDEFEGAMLSVFTPEYFAELNGGASYTDGDGVYHERTIFAEQSGDLYHCGGARGSIITFLPPEEFELITEGNDEISFYVVGTYDDFAMDEDGVFVHDENGDYARAGNPVTEKLLLTLVHTEAGWRFSKFSLAY